MEMSLERLVRWLVYALLLSAPAFVCIDVAAADFERGVTSHDALWLFGRASSNLLNEEQAAKAASLAPRYWFMPIAIFVMSFIMATWPEPYPLKLAQDSSSKREILTNLCLIWLIGDAISTAMYINSYLGVPAIAAAIDATLQNAALHPYFETVRISSYYFLVAFTLASRKLAGMAGGNSLLSFVMLLSPVLIIPALSSTAGMLTGGVIGAHRYEEYKKRLKMEWEEYFGSSSPSFPESSIQTGWPSREAGSIHSSTKHSSETKMQDMPDIAAFKDHLYRSVENAKRRGGDERRMRNIHAREHQEAAGEMREFKRRVKEKDRTWYIV